MYRIPINVMQFPDILKGLPTPTICQVASALTLLYAQNASASEVLFHSETCGASQAVIII